MAFAIAGSGSQERAALGKWWEWLPLQRLQVDEPGLGQGYIVDGVVSSDDDDVSVLVEAA